MTKIRSITKLYSTLLYSIYLLYEYSKRFVQPVAEPVVQPVVLLDAECKRTFSLLRMQQHCPHCIHTTYSADSVAMAAAAAATAHFRQQLSESRRDLIGASAPES